MYEAITSRRYSRLCVSLALAFLSIASIGQDTSPFSIRMVFYGPATDSTYAAEHRIRQVIKTRDSEDQSSWMVYDLLNFGSYASQQ
ncbi:MAG: hypothetical protein MUE88_06340 [Flavobacteriales bacterium]|jgi:hypothetical protein|nr:hypothetical protein [Flavobacteriales bacterium]